MVVSNFAQILLVFFFSSGSLWYRLERDYGEVLDSHPGSTKKGGIVVCKKETPLSKLVDLSYVKSAYDSSSEESSTSGSEAGLNMTMSSSANEKAEFHHTALLLKNSIARAEKPSIYPRSSTSLNTLKACDSIPPELYNFICLVTGLTEDTDHEQVKPDQDSSTKAVSICQDIMSLATGNPSVKSMALGLTVRHATGSKYLINLLNGLGHTPTYDAVLRAETMIAYQQRKNTTTGQWFRHITLCQRYNVPACSRWVSGVGIGTQLRATSA